MKRLTWFVGGVAAGAAGASYASRKVKSAATALAPSNVARRAADGVKSQVDRVRDAVHDGVDAMRAKESEMRARRDGRIEPLDTGLQPGDRVLIEGRLVEPAEVVILRDEAARRRGRRHPPRRAH